jgi:cytochrome c peroxidase
VAGSTCHDPARAFADGRPTSIGVKGRVGQRNASTILNALYNKTQFWDGRVITLEEQAALPIINPVEMGQPSIDAAVAGIAAIDEYQQAFRKVFGSPPNGLVGAIASYERTQVSFDSQFDRFIAGDTNAIDDSAMSGWELFNTQGACNKCHALTEEKRDVTTFTDNDFHNIGIGIIRHNVVALARQAEPHQLGRCRGRRSRGHSDGYVGARLLSVYQESGRYCRLQDVGCAQRIGDWAVFSRRFARDAVGRHRPLQQGRRAA